MQEKTTYILAIKDDEDGDELYEIDTPFTPEETWARLQEWVRTHQSEMMAYYAQCRFGLDRANDWATVMDFFVGAEHTLEEDTGIAIYIRLEHEDFYRESTAKFVEDL